MSASKMSPLSILSAPLRLALFDPRVTGPLLVALLYYPEKLRELLPERVHLLITSRAVIRTLSVLLGLSILRGVNGKLSQWSANNWKKDAKFVKSQELILISGGTSGIGKLMAEEFARRGVKVVILDLNPPKAALRKFFHFSS
jgi:all-trans-retinol dehydrogenase (NAD+)